MDRLKVTAAIFDVETTDILLVRELYDMRCFHNNDGNVHINHIRLNPVYAGTSENVEMIAFAAKCTCGKVYMMEVYNSEAR